jgi:UrcA family protein
MLSKAGIWIGAAALLMTMAWQRDALAAASTASAAGDVPQAIVHFGDLNLDQPSGVATLYHRISFAAQNVCGDKYLPGSFIISPYWRSCTAQAIARAVAAVDRPALTAYYRVHTTPPIQKLSIARR